MPKGFKTPVTTISTEAKRYKTEVLRTARRAGILRPISGRVHIHLRLYPKRPMDYLKRMKTNPSGWDSNVRCIDLDNARKVLYDSLKDVIFEDDSMVWSDSAERMVPDGSGGRVVVTVMEI